MNDLQALMEKMDELGATQQLMLEAIQSISNTLDNMNSCMSTQLEMNDRVLKMLEPSK